MVLKMDKIIEIFNCGDCPHLYYHEYDYSYCDLKSKNEKSSRLNSWIGNGGKNGKVQEKTGSY